MVLSNYTKVYAEYYLYGKDVFNCILLGDLVSLSLIDCFITAHYIDENGRVNNIIDSKRYLVSELPFKISEDEEYVYVNIILK